MVLSLCCPPIYLLFIFYFLEKFIWHFIDVRLSTVRSLFYSVSCIGPTRFSFFHRIVKCSLALSLSLSLTLSPHICCHFICINVNFIYNINRVSPKLQIQNCNPQITINPHIAIFYGKCCGKISISPRNGSI